MAQVIVPSSKWIKEAGGLCNVDITEMPLRRLNLFLYIDIKHKVIMS